MHRVARFFGPPVEQPPSRRQKTTGPMQLRLQVSSDVRLQVSHVTSGLNGSIRTSTDLGCRRARARLRLRAAGHLRAVSERKSPKNRVPVSSRSWGPANDPSATHAAVDSTLRSGRSHKHRGPRRRLRQQRRACEAARRSRGVPRRLEPRHPIWPSVQLHSQKHLTNSRTSSPRAPGGGCHGCQNFRTSMRFFCSA